MVPLSLGVDIGGSGIKVGLVDITEGTVVMERVRVGTPSPATPEAVTEAVAGIVAGFRYDGPVGIGFPAVVDGGVIRTANHIDPSWIGINALVAFADALGREVGVINDADAAALCEARYGAARTTAGVTMVLTFGTGIGSGMLYDGRLVPNIEVGMMELDGFEPAEIHYSARARTEDGLDWVQWAARASRFLRHVHRVFAPRLMVIGGGIAADWDHWGHLLPTDLPIVPATRGADAGVVGAATLVG